MKDMNARVVKDGGRIKKGRMNEVEREAADSRSWRRQRNEECWVEKRAGQVEPERLLHVDQQLWNADCVLLRTIEHRPQFGHEHARVFRIQKPGQIDLYHLRIWILEEMWASHRRCNKKY